MTNQLQAMKTLPGLSELKEVLGGAIAAKEHVALAVVDIDHFKSINDEMGHHAGDSILVALSVLLSEVDLSTIYRTGGDEFAVALVGVSLEHAFLRMETLRSLIAKEQERFRLLSQHPVTVTIGVSQYPRDAKDLPSLLRAADAAVVAAKEAGGNQVALPPNEEMVMKSCYYPFSSVRNLKALAERTGRKESSLLREGLDDLLRKHDQPDRAKKAERP